MKIYKIEAAVDDPRGRLVQVTSRSVWKQLNIITRKKGSLGGGHYHLKNREFFYLLEGKLILKIVDCRENNMSSHCFEKGDCFEIFPYEQHYMKFLEDTTLVVLYSEIFNQAAADTFIEETLPSLKDLFVD